MESGWVHCYHMRVVEKRRWKEEEWLHDLFAAWAMRGWALVDHRLQQLIPTSVVYFLISWAHRTQWDHCY